MKKLMLACFVVALLSACGLTKKNLGLEKVAPDEGQNSAKEQLVVPPNYNLRPVVPTENNN